MKGKKLLITILLILIFALIGFFNTFVLETEQIGGYRHYLGIGAWFLAAIEIIVLIKSYLPSQDDLWSKDQQEYREG